MTLRFSEGRVVRAGLSYIKTVRSFSRDASLYLVTAALFGFAIFGGIYTTLLNLYLLRLGYGPEFAGLVNGVGQVAFGLCALPVGVLGRTWGSRRLLIVGLSLMALGFSLLPLVEFSPLGQTGWLLASHTVAQIGIAIYFVNGSPFIMTVTTPAERNHVFAASIALLPLSGFAGSLVGGFLPGLFARPFGFSLDHPAPYQYSLQLAAALLLLAVLAMLKTRTRDLAPLVISTGDEPAPTAAIVILSLAILFRVIGEGAIRTFLNIYLDAGLAVPVAQIGLILAVGQVLAIPASLVMPLLAHRWGMGSTYLYSTWGMTLGFVPLALVSHWAAAGLGYMLVMTFLGIARPAIVSFQMAAVPSGWRTIMAGGTTTAVGLGWAIASLSGGYMIAAFGYPALFLAGAAMTAIAAVVFWAYFR